MRRPARRYRLLLATFAMVQVAAPLAATLADAAFAADAQWLGLHIEDHGGGRQDHPPHRDDCFLCQFLAQPAVTSHPDLRQPVAVVVASFATSVPIAPRLADALHLPDSRAPPRA